MAHQSLYRKYRPQRFDELIGQEHVSAALRNAVREDRVGHAYLFSGPRGTGKTTSARILAKALNCAERATDGEPCGKCDACLGVAAGSSLDVIEIDAASNNGVDEMRELIEKVAYRSAGGGRKVYIIDEVHELTGRASNALLKTLEEPPDHVIFVLATTNPEKVLPTIRSRTQHFEFTLLTQTQLVAHLADVVAREDIEADAGALDAVARRAAGSVRDALSLLDQAIAHGALRDDEITELFGGTPFAKRIAMLQAIGAEDAAAALTECNALLEGGQDPRRVAEDVVRCARDAFVLTAAQGRVRVDVPAEDLVALETIGRDLGAGTLVRIIETLGRAIADMRGAESIDPQLVLEVALVMLARRDTATSLQALADRVERLERGVPTSPSGSTTQGAPSVAPASRLVTATEPLRTGGGPKAALGALRGARGQSPAAADEAPTSAPLGAVAPAIAPSPAGPLAIDSVITVWPAVLAELPIATRSSVLAAVPLRIEDGNVIVFGVPSLVIEAAKPRFQRAAGPIREALTTRLGREPRFKLVIHDVEVSVADDGDESPLGEEIMADEIAELPEISANDPAHTPVGRLLESFGGEVIDEQPR